MTVLIKADSLATPLLDDTVDLVVTSPPYWGQRSYQDGGDHYDGQIGAEANGDDFVDALIAVTKECVRVTKPPGSIFVNLGDKYIDKSLLGIPWRYALRCVDELDLTLRAEIVWAKPNALPEPVTDRVRRGHEQWFHLTLSKHYYTALDEIREPYKTKPQKQSTKPYTADGKANHGTGATTLGMGPVNPIGKPPGSIWEIPSEGISCPDHLGVKHFAAFPQEFPRRIILGWSPLEICQSCGHGRRPVVERDAEYAAHRASVGDWNAPNRVVGGYKEKVHHTSGGKSKNFKGYIVGYKCECPDTSSPTQPGVVFDPFVGTGTVPMVARALGRVGIGVDLSTDYLRLANWRVFKSDHASKSIERTAAGAGRLPTPQEATGD